MKLKLSPQKTVRLTLAILSIIRLTVDEVREARASDSDAGKTVTPQEMTTIAVAMAVAITDKAVEVLGA